MTIEQPVINLVTLEVWDPAGDVWAGWTEPLTDVRVHRGGTKSGTTVSVEPGTLLATFLNAGDPLADPSLKPNLPIRLIGDDEQPIFTGRIQDLDTVYALDKNTGVMNTYVTLTATDAVQAHANTKRFGATGDQSWADRINSLSESAIVTVEEAVDSVPPSPFVLQPIVYEGPLAEHYTYACDSVGAAWWVDNTNLTRFRAAADTPALKAVFTDVRTPAELEYVDIEASYDTRNTVNTIEVINHGADRLGQFADDLVFTKTNHESVTEWGARLDQLDTTLQTGTETIVNLVQNPSYEVDVTSFTEVGSNATSRVQRFDFPLFGDSYLEWNASGAASDLRIVPDSPNAIPTGPGQILQASVYIRSSVARSARLRMRFYNAAGSQLTTVDGDQITTSTSEWQRISVYGIAPNNAASVMFWAATTGNSSGNKHYLDGAMLTEGPALHPFFDGDTPNVDEATYEWLGEEGLSQSRRIDRSYINTRLDQILDKHSTPQITISRIRWNAQENPEIAAQLDIQDRIGVTFRGHQQDSRIVGIEHELTADSWMISLELVRD